MYGHQSGCLSVYWLMHVTIFLHLLLNHCFDIGFVSYRERMLPPEAFGSRSQPQSQGQQFINYDEHYDDYYGNQNTSYGGSNYEVQ